MLFVGIAVIGICTVIYCATLALLFGWLRRIAARARHIHDFFHDTALMSGAVGLLLTANLLQALIWAMLFVALGEFDTLSQSFNFALVSYSSLGYGDVVLSETHAVLGPLTAAHGALMLGLSTSLLFWLIGTLVRAARGKGE